MRFDSQAHLETWKATGKYPSIHDGLVQLVSVSLMDRSPVPRILDLCCSTGLLGHRLARAIGAEVLGVDGDRYALGRAIGAGLSDRVTFHHQRIDPSTFDELGAAIKQNGVTVVVGRRCFPELLGSCMWAAPKLVRELADAGVTDVFIQGRIATKRAVNPLSHIDAEVALFLSCYRETARMGDLAHLQR